MDTKKLTSWIQKNDITDTKNWYHGNGKIGIMNRKNLIAWIQKNWYHGYRIIGNIDTEKLVSWIRTN